MSSTTPTTNPEQQDKTTTTTKPTTTTLSTTSPPPPSTIIPRLHSSALLKPSLNASETLGTFTGQVWLDPIVMTPSATYIPSTTTTSPSDPSTSTPTVPFSIATVSFSPSSRTFWHKHEHGQILRVLAGVGWVCDRGGRPQKIDVGDTVWCPAGGVHWHGAAEGSCMVHEAVSLGGIEWLEEVGE